MKPYPNDELTPVDPEYKRRIAGEGSDLAEEIVQAVEPNDFVDYRAQYMGVGKKRE